MPPKNLKPKIKDPYDVTIDEIEDVCAIILGPGCTTVSSDGRQISIYYKDQLSFIFSKPKQKWILHPRASLKPNAIALSTVVFHDNFSFLIGDPFECVGDDTCIYGEAALRYASSRISQAWFGKGASSFVPVEMAEESYPELDFLLTNRGFRNLN